MRSGDWTNITAQTSVFRHRVSPEPLNIPLVVLFGLNRGWDDTTVKTSEEARSKKDIVKLCARIYNIEFLLNRNPKAKITVLSGPSFMGV